MEVNMIVRVMRLGSPDRNPIELPDGATVADALRQAGISSQGITVTVNGATAELSQILGHKQTVMVATKVAGGR